MNIIYFGKYTLNNFHASAGAKRVLNQIKYLEKQNRIKVISISKHKSSYKYNINFKRFDNKLLQLLFMPLYWFVICVLLITYRQKGKNIILLESIVELNFSIPILFCRILGYKIIHDVVENFFIQNIETSKTKFGNSFVSRFFYRYTSILTDGIIVISENLYRLYSEFHKPLIKIYNSIEIKDVDYKRNPRNKDFTFLYSGTFGTKDGVKDLILAFNQISTDNFNLKLVLTGVNKSKYFYECMDLMKNNNKINYLGYLSEENLQKEYQNADVLIVTRDNSLFADYGFPYKLSEYLTFKKPVISSSVSDIPLLFTDYIDILFTEPSNVDSIIEKMKFSIKHQSELEQLSLNGYKKAEEYFYIYKKTVKKYRFKRQ